MTPCEALHTAARRYCQERIDYWQERYARLGRPDYRKGYPDKHKNVFPRYNVLSAILVEVERLRPDQFSSLREARNRLWSVGQSAESPFTENAPGTIEQRAQQEERDLFSSFVDELDETALEQVETLPYRRTLAEDESADLWARLERQYNLERRSCWYPLFGERPPHTIALDEYDFRTQVPAERLREILADAGVVRVWELREYGPEYELDLALLDPIYNGAEGLWTSGEMDWLLYASHESTLTVCGAWLLARLQEYWPAMKEHRIDS